MFENITYESLMEEALANAPADVDTRQGSIYYDAVAGMVLKLAKVYTDMDIVAGMMSIATATGEALDERAAEYGVTRLAATPASYHAIFTGTNPVVGTRFYHEGTGIYFTVLEDSLSSALYFEAETPGTAANGIPLGATAVPVTTVAGLASASFGALIAGGTDEETDTALRDRVQEKLSGPSENGNKQHYKTWCESIDGIGVARVFPLWNGPNTVKAILIDPNGDPCSAAKVAEVQNYVDPNSNGATVVVDGVTYNVGDGLGEGVANLGAHFTAASAVVTTVNVAYTADLASGYTLSDAAEETEEAVSAYLKELTMNSEDDTQIVVRISRIGAIISGLPAVDDYSSLTINSGSTNLTIGQNNIPAMGGVTITV